MVGKKRREPSPMEMRIQNALWCSLTVLASLPIFAFTGKEHRDLSNMALMLAEAHVDDAVSEKMRNAVRMQLDPKEKEGTFGELTAAVDSFTRPQRLPESDPWPLIRSRRHQIAKNLWAKHGNNEHFQIDALTAYVAEHKLAVEFAPKDPDRALHTEAIALHFLQDALSAGHIVTPRNGMRDAVAGSLHDVMNYNGADVRVSGNGDDVWTRLLDTLDATTPLVPPLGRLNVRGPIVLVVKKEEIQPMRELLLGDGERKRFKGDAHLDQMSLQKLTLLLLSARSIADVLEASTAKQKATRVCFTPRNVEVDKNGFARENTFEGSSGGFGVVSTPALQTEIARCASGERWLAYYEVDWNEEFKRQAYSFSGLQTTVAVGASANGDHREMVELAWIMGAEDPPKSVMVRDATTRAVGYVPVRGDASLRSITLHGSYVRGDGYDAFGGHGEFTSQWGFLEFGPRVGLRRYEIPTEVFYRFEYGARVVAGVSIFNLMLLVERGGVRIDPEIDTETFVYGGLEISLSRDWLLPKG
ncbi:MAG TPA: hypothetical protein VGQ36_08480, partial [Thermoanaerobaculia bacterium]|nr:hypothetical protein [Thermoanaerobaculia bacterium]